MKSSCEAIVALVEGIKDSAVKATELRIDLQATRVENGKLKNTIESQAVEIVALNQRASKAAIEIEQLINKENSLEEMVNYGKSEFVELVDKLRASNEKNEELRRQLKKAQQKHIANTAQPKPKKS